MSRSLLGSLIILGNARTSRIAGARAAHRASNERDAEDDVEGTEWRAKETANVATANRNYRRRLMIACFITRIYSHVLKSKTAVNLPVTATISASRSSSLEFKKNPLVRCSLFVLSNEIFFRPQIYLSTSNITQLTVPIELKEMSNCQNVDLQYYSVYPYFMVDVFLAASSKDIVSHCQCAFGLDLVKFLAKMRYIAH